MLWQNSDDTFEQPFQTQSTSITRSSPKTIDCLEEKKAIQLNKFRDPATDLERQAYIAIATQFGDLLAKNYIDEMIITMLTEDCEFYLFSSTEREPMRYSLKPEGIKDLYKGVQVQERQVKETYVDLVKSGVIQLSIYKILYQNEELPVEEYALEIMTIRDGKISKYRASFGCRPHGDEEDPFGQTRKDQLLAKVKQINYALAGTKPDFDKVGALLSENIEYKVWSWESQKCFTFSKRDFAEGFRNLEVNLAIKCIVPYDSFIDKKYVVGNYAYHLEGKSGIYTNQKYVWLNKCVYAFDEDLNIIRVNQQGELHKEGAVVFPFETLSRDFLVSQIQEASSYVKASLDMFYSDIVHFSCPLYRFAPKELKFRGLVKGLQQMDEVISKPKKRIMNMELKKFVEVYIDSGDASYDVAIMVGCNPGTVSSLECQSEVKPLDIVNIGRACLENGKIAKILLFTTEIHEPVPSPFEDPDFEGQNVKPKRTYM